MNDNFDEENKTNRIRDAAFAGMLYEAEMLEAARDNEPHLGRQHRLKIVPSNGWPEGDLAVGAVTIGNASPYARPVPGTVTWTIPAGLKVYWREESVQDPRWLPVPANTPIPFRGNAYRDIAVEGISPTSDTISVSFTPDENYTANATPIEDSVMVHAVKIDLIADSNRDGTIDTTPGGADDRVEGTKRADVPINRDDDDQNGVWDNVQQTHTPYENDLVEMKLRILPENPSSDLLAALEGYVVTVRGFGNAFGGNATSKTVRSTLFLL